MGQPVGIPGVQASLGTWNKMGLATHKTWGRPGTMMASRGNHPLRGMRSKSLFFSPGFLFPRESFVHICFGNTT